MPEAKDILREYIKARGMRYTPERQAIAREILSRHDHFTADDIHLALRPHRPISRASIYRTIPLLIAAGLVAQVFVDGGQIRYEHTYGHEHHCHLRCSVCGKVVEFAAPVMMEVEQKAGEKHGFKVTGHKLEVHGLCPNCRGPE